LYFCEHGLEANRNLADGDTRPPDPYEKLKLETIIEISKAETKIPFRRFEEARSKRQFDALDEVAASNFGSGSN